MQVAKRTQASVTDLARKYKHAQTPAYYDEIVGDVVLNGTLDPKQGDGDDPAAGRRHTRCSRSPLPRRDAPRADQLNAPLANFMRHNGGWSVTLSFADPVTAISWRFGENGNFKETGFLDTLDPRTRKRMPNPSLAARRRRAGRHDLYALCRHPRRMGRAVPDQVRSRRRA